MNKEIFETKKEALMNFAKEILSHPDVSAQDKISLNKLIELLNIYFFENRLKQKGLLSHTIIDSLELDYTIGKEFIKFDNDIM